MIIEDFEGWLYTSDLEDPFKTSQNGEGAQLKIRCLTTSTYNNNTSKELLVRYANTNKEYEINNWKLDSISLYFNWFGNECPAITVIDPTGEKAKIYVNSLYKGFLFRPIKADFAVTVGYRIIDALKGLEMISKYPSINASKEDGIKGWQ